MVASRALLLALAISSILLAHAVLASAPSKAGADPELDEDLSFLDDDDAEDAGGNPLPHSEPEENDGPKYSIDETDVVVLADSNFSDFLASHRRVLVEFYVPNAWCKGCRILAPEYAAAATALRGEVVVLAKVNAAVENMLTQKYDLQAYPTLLYFADGVQKNYPGQRNRYAIVSWIKKKIGPGVENITTVEEAENILTSENKLALGFLDSLVGAESQELSAASKLEDTVSFYQTDNPDVAKLFHIDANAKRPSLVLLKKEVENIAYYDGKFSKSAIAKFVSANKLPLVTTFTREIAPEIFDNPIKRQLMLFAVSNDAKKLMPAFEEAAKLFKGRLIFVYMEMDNPDVGKPVSNFFGVTGGGPLVLAYTRNEDAKKYIFDGEVTLDNIKKFAEDFLKGKLKPFYKSDPIPEINDGDVKIVVGKNFDKIVLDESKDVFLEVHAPWCDHCQEIEPTFNKLAKHLRGIESLVIAKMDGTTNEHPRVKIDGFPTILFFPAGKKSSDPIVADKERTVKEFYKFIKKHATIPFELKRPALTGTVSEKSSNADVRDEL